MFRLHPLATDLSEELRSPPRNPLSVVACLSQNIFSQSSYWYPTDTAIYNYRVIPEPSLPADYSKLIDKNIPSNSVVGTNNAAEENSKH